MRRLYAIILAFVCMLLGMASIVLWGVLQELLEFPTTRSTIIWDCETDSVVPLDFWYAFAIDSEGKGEVARIVPLAHEEIVESASVFVVDNNNVKAEIPLNSLSLGLVDGGAQEKIDNYLKVLSERGAATDIKNIAINTVATSSLEMVCFSVLLETNNVQQYVYGIDERGMPIPIRWQMIKGRDAWGVAIKGHVLD